MLALKSELFLSVQNFFATGDGTICHKGLTVLFKMAQGNSLPFVVCIKSDAKLTMILIVKDLFSPLAHSFIFLSYFKLSDAEFPIFHCLEQNSLLRQYLGTADFPIL